MEKGLLELGLGWDGFGRVRLSTPWKKVDGWMMVWGGRLGYHGGFLSWLFASSVYRLAPGPFSFLDSF